MQEREQLLKAYGFRENQSGAFVFKERVGSVGGAVYLIAAAFKDNKVVKVMLLDGKDKHPKFVKRMNGYDIPFEKIVNQRLRQLEPVIGTWMCCRRLNTSCNNFILK